MRPMILFTKSFRERTVEGLVQLARETGAEGFDLCVRPGYPVDPENAEQALPEAVRVLKDAGLAVPMVTGHFDLLRPDHPSVRPLLSGLRAAGVRFLKLGYFPFDPDKHDYWSEVERIREAFEGWVALAREYGVTVCYHTHSNRCMGLNAAALAHLLRGFDPDCLGAYLDPYHLCVEGEEFSVGLAMVREHLRLVALKDVLLVREAKNGHGATIIRDVPAGDGMVDWTAVFEALGRASYEGPLSVHCELEPGDLSLAEIARREIDFFKRMRARAEQA